MFRRSFTFWLGVAWLGLAPALADVPSVSDEPKLTEEEVRLNVESFDVVWSTIRDRHWEADMGGRDWDAVRDELRPAVLQAETMDAAREPIDTMLERLGMSHYALIPAEVYDELGGPLGQGAGDGFAGIDLRVIDGHVLVTAVAAGSPADRAGVRPGWIVTRIDGEELAPALAKAAERFGDTLYEDMALAGVAMGRLAGPMGAERSLTLTNGAGETVQVALELAEQRGEKIEVGFLPPLHVWMDDPAPPEPVSSGSQTTPPVEVISRMELPEAHVELTRLCR